jgi:hypothetical protein
MNFLKKIGYLSVRLAGTTVKHKLGCKICKTPENCTEENNILCPCKFHTLERTLKPYDCELDAREKALKQPAFPFQQV